jgi:BirA family biotin operon repressor/biotin-[acetyl-CoA-carboxylase] ligase
LDEEGFGALDVVDLAADLVRRFDDGRQQWARLGFAAVRDAWLAAAYGRGQRMTVRLQGEIFDGTFADMDADGALLVEVAGGQRRVTAGDVFFAGT